MQAHGADVNINLSTASVDHGDCRLDVQHKELRCNSGKARGLAADLFGTTGRVGYQQRNGQLLIDGKNSNKLNGGCVHVAKQCPQRTNGRNWPRTALATKAKRPTRSIITREDIMNEGATTKQPTWSAAQEASQTACWMNHLPSVSKRSGAFARNNATMTSRSMEEPSSTLTKKTSTICRCTRKDRHHRNGSDHPT